MSAIDGGVSFEGRHNFTIQSCALLNGRRVALRLTHALSIMYCVVFIFPCFFLHVFVKR